MKRIFLKAFFLLLFFTMGSNFAWTQDKDTTVTEITEIGQIVPDFSLVTTDGDKLSMTGLRGKVVLINFFATWCGPCNLEMPHLEKAIWQSFKNKDFLVLSIGREHAKAEVAQFKKEKNLSFPMAPDPDREIYKKFATMYIPRNIIVDKKGRIVLQEKGFNEDHLKHMITTIQELLK